MNPQQRPNLATLPVELQQEILGETSFEALVSATRTSRSVRGSALALRKLWQVLPEVTVDEVDNLDQFINRVDPAKGVDLGLTDIREDEIPAVADAVLPRLARLRGLRLEFARDEEHDEEDTDDEEDDELLADIWTALNGPAPLLERFALDTTGRFAALPSMPDWLFMSAALPLLTEVQITAVKLEDPVPAFANARTVRVAVASLAQFDRHENNPIEAHFPAARSLTLLGIQSLADGGADAHTLLNVPFVQRPLYELILRFDLQLQSVLEEPEVGPWLDASLPHVEKATIIDNRCEATREKVLTSLKGPEPLAVQLTPAAGVQDVVVANSAGRSRTVRFGGPVAHSHFAKILELPGPVVELSIPGDVAGLAVLHAFAQATRLERLALDVDGGFQAVPGLPKLNSVRALRLGATQRVDVDAQLVIDFIVNVTPRVTQVVFSKFVRVLNLHLLPVPYVLVD